MTYTIGARLRDILLALLAAALLGMPVLAQEDNAPDSSEPPVEDQAPADPGEPLEDPEDAQDPDSPQEPESPVEAPEPEQPEEPAEQPEEDMGEDADMDAAPAQDPAAAAPAPAFGNSRMIDVPLESGMREFRDSSWIRVLNLSPNIGDVDFNLVSTDADASAVTTPEFMRAVEYEGHGTYVEVPAGEYRLNLTGNADDDMTFSVNDGRFYTLVVMGLEVPPEAQTEEQQGGFMNWLTGLFGGDDGDDAYSVDILLLEDDLYQTNLENESMIRLVNAAPGTEAVTLAVTGESGTLTGDAAYGNATGYNRVNAAEFSGPLELRIGGSRAATIPLDEVNFVPGSVNTVFLVGTPVEAAPLRAVVLSTPSFTDNF